MAWHAWAARLRRIGRKGQEMMREGESDLRDRFRQMIGEDLLGEVRIERGGPGDYAALSVHHYRAGRPGSMMRVWAARRDAAGVVGRFTGRRAEWQTVGVLIESMPSLLCKMRDWATSDRYAAWPAKQRAVLLRDEVRCISRVIVHPQWRGLGLAVRLVKAALDEPVTIFTEALAAMGQVNPFFEKAGMTAYPRPSHEHDRRLSAALAAVGIEQIDVARAARFHQRLRSIGTRDRRWMERELVRWHRRTDGRGRGGGDPVAAALEAASKRLLFQPVYYVKDNRAAGAKPND